ncbi:MAG: cupin domain-containing protein [Ignavibacteriae bacterium]|nr:cupin domain-containing protein [Ignavibacteriota bacterium]MCB9215015.1 cupin domain-containing protein [Ignavibacteria bacterium]
MAVVDIHSAEHYRWGDQCDGWHFLQTDKLSVIREWMSPGTSEVKHYHERADQFFYIVSGRGTMEIGGEVLTIEEDQGLRVSPGIPHRISNRSERDLHFLVISAPQSRGDRIEIS